MRERFNASEIIVTIMLNYVAVQMVSYLIRGPMEDPMRFFPRSYPIPPDCVLPVIVQGTRLHAGLFVAIVMVVVFAIMQRKRYLAFSPRFSAPIRGPRPMPVSSEKPYGLVMAVSGGLAGLAGAVEVGGFISGSSTIWARVSASRASPLH